MTNSDRESFARMLFALGDTFNEPVSDLRTEAYFDALGDLPIMDVLAAGRRALAECRFFPRPVELRELIAGSTDDNAELAWATVRRMVQRVGYCNTPGENGYPDWPDDATRRAALELYGGWRALCENLPASGPELLGYRKTFVATYRAYAGRDRRDELAALPPGAAGYLES